MPKLYEYFGIIIMFYSNEHEPVHVHGKYQGCEAKAEIILINGAVQEINYSPVAGRAPLGTNEMRFFQELVTMKADEIVATTHYPEVEMSNTTINMVSATQIGDYQLKLVFDDKTTQTVDFGQFLMRSRHPDVRAYLQPERFAAFHIEHGELVWGDYDLCFPLIDLYQNHINHNESLAQAA